MRKQRQIHLSKSKHLLNDSQKSEQLFDALKNVALKNTEKNPYKPAEQCLPGVTAGRT